MKNPASFPVRRHTLALITGLLLFTGCITIEENYTFKKNGSGTMEYVVDLSELGELMDSMKDMGGEKSSSDKLELGQNADALKGIAGISGVKTSEKNWVKRISFKFKDLTALNAALNVLLPDSTNTNKEFFAWEDNVLVRRNNRHAVELGAGMSADGEGDAQENKEAAEGMLETMKYKYSFAFAKPIAQMDIAGGMQEERQGTRKVRLETDFSAIMKDPETLDLRISLDN